MTTEDKISHIRWYIAQRDASRNAEMQEYYKNNGMGALGAWFADMTINHTTYNTLKTELQKEITQ